MNKRSFLCGLIFFLNIAITAFGMDGSIFDVTGDVIIVEPDMVDGFFVVQSTQSLTQNPDTEPRPKQALIFGTASSSPQQKETFFKNYSFVIHNATRYSTSGIFDGQLGSYAAQYAQTHLVNLIKQNLEANVLLDYAIKNSFNQIHANAIDGRNTGSSVLLAIFETLTNNEQNCKPCKFTLVHAGNSGAVLQTKNGARSITKPHIPDRQAVNQNGNFNVLFSEQHKNNVHYLENYTPDSNHGVFSVSTQNALSFYQLNLARNNQQITITNGIGHHSFFPTFKPEPKIGSRLLKGNEHFLILANSELWDAISPQAAAKIVNEFIVKSSTIQAINPNEIAQYLVRTAHNLLEKRTDRFARKENIVVTVILFAENLWEERYKK